MGGAYQLLGQVNTYGVGGRLMTKTFISRYTYAKERSHYPLRVGEQSMSIE
jgi:hypothetical protein